jgi:hypothetical protein
MELPTYFADFLAAIRPTADQKKKMRAEHKKLRDLLVKDDELGPIIVSTFIQGSYRRFTGNRPTTGCACDVDVIAVTTMHEDDYTPIGALEKFRPFLERHYPRQHSLQGRSWKITPEKEISLDLVPTSAPSEVVKESLQSTRAADWDFPDELEGADPMVANALLLEAKAAERWKSEPLRIPDHEAEIWDDTHPLEQIRWTWQKNRTTSTHYVNVVKSIKRWRQIKRPLPKYPKSYPLEHMVGDNCPDGIGSVALGVTLAFESMEANYRPYVDAGKVPVLQDRGVPTHNVLKRVSVADFTSFLGHVSGAALLARRALDATTVAESAKLWRELFGDEFPEGPDDDGGGGGSGSGGYTPRSKPSIVGGGRFA